MKTYPKAQLLFAIQIYAYMCLKNIPSKARNIDSFVSFMFHKSAPIHDSKHPFPQRPKPVNEASNLREPCAFFETLRLKDFCDPKSATIRDAKHPPNPRPKTLSKAKELK